MNPIGLATRHQLPPEASSCRMARDAKGSPGAQSAASVSEMTCAR